LGRARKPGGARQPARQIERVLATRNAAMRLPAGLDVQILDPGAIDGMLPPGAVHQGLAVRANPIETDAAGICRNTARWTRSAGARRRHRPAGMSALCSAQPPRSARERW